MSMTIINSNNTCFGTIYFLFPQTNWNYLFATHSPDEESSTYSSETSEIIYQIALCDLFDKWIPFVFLPKYFHGLHDTVNMIRSPKSEWNPVVGIIEFEMKINALITSDRSKMFGIESRKCRFDTETTSDRSYPLGLYSQNLCLMECSVDTAIGLCGCRPFFYKIGFKEIYFLWLTQTLWICDILSEFSQ